ncbi:MAG: prephenate dehydrogenase/arogenate dehydrogenase family protein [Methanolinea sp.]|nr:prephenate dehydrogenase/arogenate dehydrogenase family protein [Methanolinea sp.]
MKIGIIGGTGKMGTFFRGVFGQAGWEVMVSGRQTPLTAKDLAEQCGVIMVSVPIRETVGVIRSLAPLLSEDQLFCDLTSLKTGPVQAMLTSRAQVVGFHPMFGPTVKGLAGQTIIATPARCDQDSLERILSVFRSQGARVTISTPEEHDRIMAVVQGLTHFMTLCVAETMRRVGMSPEDTLAFMSPVYQIEMGLVGRLLSQDPLLYADILELNPHVPPVLEACESALSSIRGIIEDGDTCAFEKVFRENARNFGDYCQKAARESDMLIAAMVRR